MADENTMLRGCRTTCTPLPEDPVPGIAYVPFQQWSETYEPARALDALPVVPVHEAHPHLPLEDMGEIALAQPGKLCRATHAELLRGMLLHMAAHFRRAVRDVGAAFVSGFASVLQRSGEKACCLPRGIR